MADTGIDSPLALYVHIPFCVRRCSYCAFASSLYAEERATRYVEALEREWGSRAAGVRPETIYLGGGTPTSLSLPLLKRVLELCANLDQRLLREWTVEANPNTVSVEKLILLRRAGVDRISLGVQTFDEGGLQILGRLHTAKEARAAVACCREAGFDDISLDFIFGWPGQTESQWRDDLETVLRLDVPHVSCYNLSYEPDTPLEALVAAGRLIPQKEEDDRRLFDLTALVLERAGLRRYEISNYARPGCESRHNTAYWIGQAYLGLGASAHSYVDGLRFANCNDVETYVRMMQSDGTARVFEERLPDEKRARECAVMWLRLRDGIPPDVFYQRTGMELQALLAPESEALIAQGWLEWSSTGQLRLTENALPLADSVLAELVG